MPIAMNAIALAPEVIYPVPNLNDDSQHIAFVKRAADGWARGENLIDLWVPQFELGVPQFLDYQHLPHVVVVMLGRLAFDAIDLRTLFDLVRYILLVGFPLTVFWSMRTMGLSTTASAIGAAASSLLSGNHRYGFEYDSYIWRGYGVFTQLFAMHLSFIALATLQRVARTGQGILSAALACSALALSHLLYAYIVAISAAVVLLFGVSRATLASRTARFGAVGAITAAATSYMWLPFLAYSPFINVTPYLDPLKYDSYGAPAILTWLVTGDLFDHGRVPVLTALLGAGAVGAIVSRARVPLMCLALFALWLVLYFGRPTLGALIDVLPLSDGLFLHRLIGAVDAFAIVLMGVGGAWLWDLVRASTSRQRLALAGAATLLALTPALVERWGNYAQGADWMRRTQAAIDADGDAHAIIATLRAQPTGRVYAGHGNDWGRSLDFGIPFRSVRFYNLAAHHGFEMSGPPNQSLSLNADLLWDFNDQDLSHYRLFNVAYVIAPRGRAFPPELRALETTNRYVLYAAPGRGYAEYATIAQRETPATQEALFAHELAWLRSGGPARWSFTRLDYPRATDAQTALPIQRCASGEIAYQRAQPARFDLVVRCESPAAMVLKVTYHPNWRVTVDGNEVATFMASPSYIGFAVPPGEHFVVAEYRSTPMKAPLLALGGLVLAAVIGVSRRAWLIGLPIRPRALLGRFGSLRSQWPQRRARRE